MVGAVQKCTPQNYTLKYGGIPIFWVIAGVCSAEQSQKKGHKIMPATFEVPAGRVRSNKIEVNVYAARL